MALAIGYILIGILLGCVMLAGSFIYWQKYLTPARKDREQMSRGLIPDRYLPPELWEENLIGEPESPTWHRRMDPINWQDTQERIAEHITRHPPPAEVLTPYWRKRLHLEG